MDVQPVHVPERDKRFADPTWSKNPAFFAAQHGYLAASQLVSDLSATRSATPGPGLPPAGRARAGIVNPPGPRAWYEAAGYAGPDPEA